MLSNRIKQFRTYNKLDAKSIAKALDIDVNEYLKYESGEKMPDIDAISALSKIYKVTVSEFYGNTPRIMELQSNEFSPTQKYDEFEALKFSELSIDEKELILAYRVQENKEPILKFLEKNKKKNKKSDWTSHN